MSRDHKVKLKSSDNEIFEVDESVARESQFLKNVIEDTGTAHAFPLPNVESKTLAKVIEYATYHVESRKSADDQFADPHHEILKQDAKWDAEFIKVDQATLFHLPMAASYLQIDSVYILTCQAVADMIQCMTPEQVRKTFNVENDFTPEEEEKIKREYPWAFE